MAKTLCYLVTALCLNFASAQAAILQVATSPDGRPQLRGALGVDVAGTLYDVTFTSRECINFYSFCTDFPFDTETEARSASQALLDQVLVDSSLGPFDSFPELTFGCGGLLIAYCDVMTPFRRDDGSFVSVASARNWSRDFFPFESIEVFQHIASIPNDSEKTLARWSLSSANPVPEPGTLALFGLALFGLVWRLRY